MSGRIIPEQNNVRELVDMLSDSTSVVSLQEEAWKPSTEVFYAGAYLTSSEEPRVLVIIDLPLAASLGAILVRHMPGVAEDAIKANALSEDLYPNLLEVMNVFAGTLNSEGVEHVVFREGYPNSELPKSLSDLLAGEPHTRADYTVGIPRYFDGKLAFLAFD